VRRWMSRSGVSVPLVAVLSLVVAGCAPPTAPTTSTTTTTVPSLPPSAITAGDRHTCALVAGGQVRCWGKDESGQLGTGVIGDGSSTSPRAVSGLVGAVQVTTGANHSCALVAGGEVRCWGDNSRRQLGNGTNVDSGTPTLVTGLSGVTQVAAGDLHTCALIATGEPRCWGDNTYKQLGITSPPVSSPTPVAVSGLLGVTQIVAGGRHTCALVSEGQARCWGNNAYGQLGNGLVGGNPSSPATVSGLSNATQISAGRFHTCAIVGGTQVRCWGSNGNAELGDGTLTNSAVPVVVTGLSTVSSVSWVTTGNTHSCVLVAGGAGRCWGGNSYGVLGNGTSGRGSRTPVEVSGLSGATQLTTHDDHTCALLQGGDARCWGYNLYGQLGDGTRTTSSTPVVVLGLS
jgi:alpha-tubulin suppressor-like RCC1 family protein